jgi:hypothetical protein
MPITIEKVPDGYVADVTPPHGRGEAWSTPTPLSADALIAALRSRGCHQTDIGDAFHEADPNWQSG